jgi:hypothetical protein
VNALDEPGTDGQGLTSSRKRSRSSAEDDGGKVNKAAAVLDMSALKSYGNGDELFRRELIL